MAIHQMTDRATTNGSVRASDEWSTTVKTALCDPVAVRELVDRAERSDRLRVANARMQADLDAAARIQRSLLPRQSPLMHGVRVAWEVLPCTELAGDILDVFALDEDHLALYVVDVSGHGVAAAMLSHTVHRLLSSPASIITRRRGGEIVGPAEVCRQLNELLPMDPETRQYATLLYGVIDLRARTFRFASAGHCPPVLTSIGGPAVEIPARGFPIGAFPDSQYEEHVVHVPPRARLHLYSDGLVELGAREGVFVEPAWLLQVIEESGSRSVEASVPFILERARGVNPSATFSDDVSLLVLEIE